MNALLSSLPSTPLAEAMYGSVYQDGGIGSAHINEPFIPGHEFGAYLTEDDLELGLSKGGYTSHDPLTRNNPHIPASSHLEQLAGKVS